MGLIRNTLIILSLLLAITFQALANWSSEEPQTRKHVVRPNETLEVIAGSYGFEVNELALYNKLNTAQALRVGQVIYFPSNIVPDQSGRVSAEQGRAPEVSVFPNSVGDFVDQGRPLDARAFPKPDSSSVNAETARLMPLLNDEQLSGKEADISQYGSQAHFVATSDFDYNFAQKDVRQPVNQMPQQSSKNLNMMGSDAPYGNKMVISAEEAIQDAIDDFEGTIGDDESPALAAFGVRPYAYFGNGDSLKEVLQNFASSYYMPAIIADTVVGEVNGKIGPLTPVDFLDHLANIYGFIWYFDGHTLFVYDGSASSQQIISLNYLPIKQLKKTLKKIGIWDGRFFWKEQPQEGLVFISGPPRYIELVSQTVLLLDAKEGERQKSKLTVRTFPLKYAWATDKSFTFRGQQLTVPGVATILTRIIKGGGVAQVTRQGMPNPSMTPAESVSQSGEPALTEASGPSVGDPLNAGAEADEVYINADPRLNAIIVHDLESKMLMYEELIASLDKPTSQVEISISIIDINTQDLQALGVDWNNSGSSSDSKFSFTPNLSPDYATVISSTFGSFEANLRLLADEGRAKIVSRPSILTLDNIEAILDNSSTFYVAVEGREDSELFPVTSGTVVQVTPRIVREDQGRRIHMSVNIQDGTGSQGTEEIGQKLPEVTNSSINTQAIISEQESLLIGGFYKEQEEEKLSKVPLLGDIPVLGHLFRAESTSKIKQVRLFLITPRIIGSTET
ncbi:type III secretion system outer membrane ring subunit SctC [Endozoicomonas sp. SCSIO W0465]|uniref:type III secretion system outer membrane ring subunit SctC n=1 Tax=Endozoicomonas sp. SCSIO W0465 TaxID=2918516 RepID=UPI002075346E|nr:type III secretion system outer membrane ring subunit SctC [Endozoicomonas sp. SCSIO W0465]USE35179.1 type III secretion system outer membrane ring subunit SctC [Endozoicomonas sp. SCSIO W0465]